MLAIMAKKITKVQKLLDERSLSQKDLQQLILDKTGKIMPQNSISHLVTKKRNINIVTAMLVAFSLGVTIEEINNIEIKNIIDEKYL